MAVIRTFGTRLRLLGSTGIRQALPAVASNPAPTDFTLSSTTVAETSSGAVAAGTVIGTISVVDAGDSSWTASIPATSTQFDFDNNPGASPRLIAKSGNTLSNAGGPYSLTIRITDGASNTYDEAVSINVTAFAADASLMVITITGDGSGSKTNETFEQMIPIGATALTTGRTLRVYDDDGSGSKGTVLSNFQVALPSTDLVNGNTRLVALSGIVPSLASGGTRKLYVETTGTAAPTGTAITASDVLATSFANTIEFDIAGTTYTFDVRAALAASSTFSKTDYQLVSIEAGPTRSRWMAFGPPKNSGTAHASGDGLRCAVEIVAWKATTGAVGGGNPITLVEAKVEMMNEDAVRGSPAHYFYGLAIKRATSLSDATLITTDQTDIDGNITRFAYPRESAPTGTLTATGGTSTGAQTWTRSTGTFATDCVGAHIRCGGGGAIIKTRNSATSVDVYIYQAASGTSFTSGNWSIEGIGHHYAIRDMRKLQVGTRRTSITTWGNVNSAITPNSRAPMDALVATGLYINNDVPFASISHTMTNLNAMRASDGSIRPFSFRGGNGVEMGDVETHIGEAGGRVDIGPVPAWCTDGVVKCDGDGRRKIFENAHYFATWQYMGATRLSGTVANGKLGVWPRADQDEWTWNLAQPGNGMLAPSPVWWPYDSDSAHMPLPFYFAYLMSGDIFWLRCMGRQECVAKLDTNYGFNGAGANGTTFGDPTGAVTVPLGQNQTRGKAWCLASLVQTYISTPDSISDLIVNDKAYYAARVGKTWDALKFWGPDDHGGLRSGASEGPQWLRQLSWQINSGQVPSAYIEGLWQVYMVMIVAGHAKEMGATDSDGDAGYTWLIGALVDLEASNSEVRDWTSTVIWSVLNDDDVFPSQPASWSDVYKRSALLSPIDQSGSIVGPRRTASGTVTLSSASVGTGRTITFSTAYFTNGGAWYENGFIYDLASGGTFKITAVNSGTQVTGNVVVAFGSTTPTASNIRLPGPAHGDYANEYAAISAVSPSSPDYIQKFVCAARIASGAGIQTSALDTAIARQIARTGYVESDNNMRVARRT